MGAEQHAVTEAPQRGFCRQRLNFHDLQGGGMDVAACQGRREVGFVHQRAAGDVDDADAGFHPGETGSVDQMTILRRKGAGDDHEVGFLQAVRPGCGLHHIEARGGLEIGVVGNDAELAGEQAFCGVAADVAEADESDGLSAQRSS